MWLRVTRGRGVGRSGGRRSRASACGCCRRLAAAWATRRRGCRTPSGMRRLARCLRARGGGGGHAGPGTVRAFVEEGAEGRVFSIHAAGSGLCAAPVRAACAPRSSPRAWRVRDARRWLTRRACAAQACGTRGPCPSLVTRAAATVSAWRVYGPAAVCCASPQPGRLDIPRHPQPQPRRLGILRRLSTRVVRQMRWPAATPRRMLASGSGLHRDLPAHRRGARRRAGRGGESGWWRAGRGRLGVGGGLVSEWVGWCGWWRAGRGRLLAGAEAGTWPQQRLLLQVTWLRGVEGGGPAGLVRYAGDAIPRQGACAACGVRDDPCIPCIPRPLRTCSVPAPARPSCRPAAPRRCAVWSGCCRSRIAVSRSRDGSRGAAMRCAVWSGCAGGRADGRQGRPLALGLAREGGRGMRERRT